MKNNVLRAPLIKSAVLLAVVSLVIYLTVSSPEGSIWNSIGAIFYTLFKAAQLTVGLLLALLVCFAVLVGIFFGCVAMVSSASAARMYEQSRRFAVERYRSVQALIMPGARSAPGEAAGAAARSIMRSLDEVRQAQRHIEEKLGILQERVERNEQDESITKISEWFRAEESKTEEVRAALGLIETRLLEVQQQAGEMSEKLGRMSSENVLDAVTAQLAALEKNSRDVSSRLESVQGQIDQLNDDMASFKETAAPETKAPEKENPEEHRLFSYIEDPEEKEKILQLVSEAMDQDMTYAQTVDHIAENVSRETAGIIAEHPSLTKEIIRENRKKS